MNNISTTLLILDRPQTSLDVFDSWVPGTEQEDRELLKVLGMISQKFSMDFCGESVLNECLTLQPTKFSVDKLAAYYQCVGHMEAAANLYENYLKLDPDREEAAYYSRRMKYFRTRCLKH